MANQMEKYDMSHMTMQIVLMTNAMTYKPVREVLLLIK